MDERRSEKGYQPEVTSSARVIRPPLEQAASAANIIASHVAGDPPGSVGTVSHSNDPTNPVLVSAGTTDTAPTAGTFNLCVGFVDNGIGLYALQGCRFAVTRVAMLKIPAGGSCRKQ